MKSLIHPKIDYNIRIANIWHDFCSRWACQLELRYFSKRGGCVFENYLAN